MEKRLGLLIGFVILVASVPAEAGRLGWLDKLSGPGKFYPDAPLVTVTPCEVSREDSLLSCFPDSDKSLDLKFYTTLEIGRWHADGNNRFPEKINLWTFQGVFYVPLINLPAFGDVDAMHAFDVGAGIGVYSFSGPGVKRSDGNDGGRRSRLSIPLRLRFTPSELAAARFKNHQTLRAVLSSVYFRVGFDGLPGSFSNKDFIGPPDYASESSFLDTGALVIDGSRLLRALWP